MLCTYCNTPRLAGDSPCPQCGAPSPLMGETVGGYGSVPQTTTWDASSNKVDPYGRPLERQAAINPAPTFGLQLGKQQSLLPVPYDAGLATTRQSLLLMSPDPTTGETKLLPIVAPDLGTLMHALPDADESIHIPPMYTQPRAIIPRYRIISGLLSLLIVFAFLCTGAGYYAKVSGKLAFLQQLWGDVRLPHLPGPSSPTLQNPPSAAVYGPARNIINSASTASSVDPQTDIALQPANVFSPGQVIYLTYSVHPRSAGIVVIKWYTDGLLYRTITSQTISDAKSGVFTMQFTQPLQGKVELYWKDQLAIGLFFVVR